MGEFPLAAHVAEDADQEVEDNQLVRTAVVQPLIERGSFPDGIEVKADGVRGRNNSTGDDVVAVDQRTSDRLTDAGDVDRRSGDQGNDEADGSSQQCGDHQHTEQPTPERLLVEVTHSQKACQLEAPGALGVVVMRTERNVPEGTV